MKAGKYYVGDLGYIIENSQWDDFLDIHYSSNDTEKQFLEFEFANFNTISGDGSFLSNTKKEFPVDSGTIGCISIEYLEKYNPSCLKSEKAFIFEFKSDFDCEVVDGNIYIGNISIDTNISSISDFEPESNYIEDDYLEDERSLSSDDY